SDVCRRLLRYAGMPAEVEVDASAERIGDAPVWFAGCDGGAVRFGIDTHSDADTAQVVEAACYAVAAAFRVQHGFARSDDEGPLTEVTAAYLGFGILIANAADRFRKTGHVEGNYAVTQWSHHFLGYL